MRFHGVKSAKIYNCNAGFWIVRKEAIQDFYAKAMEFFTYAREELHLVNFTERVNPAIVHAMRSKDAMIRSIGE